MSLPLDVPFEIIHSSPSKSHHNQAESQLVRILSPQIRYLGRDRIGYLPRHLRNYNTFQLGEVDAEHQRFFASIQAEVFQGWRNTPEHGVDVVAEGNIGQTQRSQFSKTTTR